jgi:hypothetical protein
MSNKTEAFEGQQTLPFYAAPEYPELDRYQRIETLQRVEGFLPVSKPEQVEVMGLLSFPSSKGGAAKHLAEIDRRQHRTEMKDPNRTTRAVARKYVGWMIDAHQSSLELEQLGKHLEEVLNPELKLNRVFEASQPGLLKFLRFYDLSLLARTGDIKTVGYDPQKVNYSVDNPGIRYYLELAMDSWRIHQLRNGLPYAKAHESNRFAFWAERNSEIIKHSPRSLGAIAHEGFDQVYGRTKV